MSENNNFYAVPRPVSIQDCDFYHVMDLPGFGRVGGQWDLRGHVDEYLGHIDLQSKRVLEIGPASGFLTIEMERRGASVVAVEVTDNPGWDFVPYPPSELDKIRPARAEIMRRIKNSFWFTHKANNSAAKLYYGDASNLPSALGTFDVAVLASVLLHTRSPLSIIEECAKRANIVIIADCLHPNIEGMPVCGLHPTSGNKSFDTWWNLSTTFLVQFLRVLGFKHCKVTKHQQTSARGPIGYFTIVASEPVSLVGSRR